MEGLILIISMMGLLVYLLVLLFKKSASSYKNITTGKQAKIRNSAKYIKILYLLFGLFIFLYPPVYFNNARDYRIYGKFAFIGNVQHVDYVLFSFEIVGLALLGIALYFFYLKPKAIEPQDIGAI